MPDSAVNIVHELTFQVNEASVQKVDETFANITRSLQALNANVRQVSRNLESLLSTFNKGVKSANAYADAMKNATAASNKFAAANANVGNLIGASIGKMTAGINQAITQMTNLQNSMLAGLTNSTKRIQALEAEAKAAQAAAAAVQNLQNAYNGLRPPSGGGAPPAPGAGGGGGGGGIGSRSNIGPMGGQGMFGISGDYLMRRFVSGYIVGGGFRALNFTIDSITDFISKSSELASKTESVTKAFQRLGDPNLLKGLRDATGGTVSDLDLMQKAVNAVNLGLPVQQLGKAFEFARVRARETGQDVDYLVNSIVLGIGRKSPLILDNLGINALRVRERFKELGDFGQAAFEIINEEIQKSGEYVDTYADRVDRLTASLANQQAQFGELTNAIKDYGMAFLLDVKDFITGEGSLAGFGFVDPSQNNVQRVKKAREEQAKDAKINREAELKAERDYVGNFQRFQDQLVGADVQARNKIRDAAERHRDALRDVASRTPGSEEDIAIRLRAINFQFQEFVREFDKTRGSIKNLTAEGLRGAKFYRDELVKVRESITDERRLLDTSDTKRIAELAALDAEAERQIDIIDAKKKKDKEKIEASAEKELRTRLAKIEEDIIQQREAREAGSEERIQRLSKARQERTKEDLQAIADDLVRRKIYTSQAIDLLKQLADAYKRLDEEIVKTETDELQRKQAQQTQAAFQAAIDMARKLQKEKEKAGVITTVSELRDQIDQETKVLLEGEELRHKEQMRILKVGSKAMEDEIYRNSLAIEDIKLESYRRQIEALGDYYNQIRVEMARAAALSMQPITEMGTAELEELNRRGPGGLTFDRQHRLRLIGARQRMREAQELRLQARRTSGVADLQAAETFLDFQSRTSPTQRQSGLRAVEDTSLAATDARAKSAKATKEAIDEEEKYKLTLQENVPKIIDLFNQMAQQVTSAYAQIASAQQAQFNTEIRIREERLRSAEHFADRGNTLYLRQEQERLDRSYKQQAAAASKQIAINTALAASQAALGVVKAAVTGTEGGPYLIIANVLAFVAAVTTGIIQATNAANNTMPSVQFWKGGYTGDGGKYEAAGTVHKGEWVSDQETTRRHRNVLEAMHDGTFDDKYVRIDQAQLSLMADPSGKRDRQIIGKLDGLIEAVENSSVNVRQSMDARGLNQMVEQIKRRERQRFG